MAMSYCLDKGVIDQLPHCVDHSGRNRYVDDCFQPNGKVFHDPILSIAVCWVQADPHRTGSTQTWNGMENGDRSKGLNEENAVVLVASQHWGVYGCGCKHVATGVLQIHKSGKLVKGW